MRVCVFVLALLVVVAFAEPAHADYPPQRPKTSWIVRSAYRSANAFWKHRRVTVTQTPVFYVVDDTDRLGDVDGVGSAVARAEWGGDRIWMAKCCVRDATADWRQHGRHSDTQYREALWIIVAHELGHTAALTFPDGPDPGTDLDLHPASGLMSAESIPTCAQAHAWAKSLHR